MPGPVDLGTYKPDCHVSASVIRHPTALAGLVSLVSLAALAGLAGLAGESG